MHRKCCVQIHPAQPPTPTPYPCGCHEGVDQQQVEEGCSRCCPQVLLPCWPGEGLDLDVDRGRVHTCGSATMSKEVCEQSAAPLQTWLLGTPFGWQHRYAYLPALYSAMPYVERYNSGQNPNSAPASQPRAHAVPIGPASHECKRSVTWLQPARWSTENPCAARLA